MKQTRWTAGAVAIAVLTGAANAHAFRMIQNTSVGRTTVGAPVACDSPGGFTHRTAPQVAWYLNPAGQGGKAGVSTAVQNAMASWNAVTGYKLSLAGTTSAAGFVSDGLNTVSWGSNSACTG